MFADNDSAGSDGPGADGSMVTPTASTGPAPARTVAALRHARSRDATLVPCKSCRSWGRDPSSSRRRHCRRCCERGTTRSSSIPVSTTTRRWPASSSPTSGCHVPITRFGGGSHAEQTGAMLTALEPILTDNRPDVVLVYGDTNSTLAGSLVAAKLTIPIAQSRRPSLVRPAHARGGQPDRRATTSPVAVRPQPLAAANLAAEGVGAASTSSAT